MSDEPNPLVFVDANVLAKAATRSLLVYSAGRSGYEVRWSAYEENEADHHRQPRQALTQVAREAARIELTPPGVDADRYVNTDPKDRQVLADAVAAGASFIITEDVDDFDTNELIAVPTCHISRQPLPTLPPGRHDCRPWALRKLPRCEMSHFLFLTKITYIREPRPGIQKTNVS